KVSLPRTSQPAPRAHVQPAPKKQRPSVVVEKRGRPARRYDDEPPPSNHVQAWVVAIIAVMVLMIVGIVVARTVLNKPAEEEVVQAPPPAFPQLPGQPNRDNPKPPMGGDIKPPVENKPPRDNKPSHPPR